MPGSTTRRTICPSRPSTPSPIAILGGWDTKMAGERMLQIVILGIGIFPGLTGRLTNGQQHGCGRGEPALIGADARRDLAAVLTSSAPGPTRGR